MTTSSTLVREPATAPRGSEVPFARVWISPEAQDAAAEVLRSGWVTTGHRVAEFEEKFADYVGARHAVGTSSCTAALEIALRTLDLPPGSRVLVSSVTFCGAVHAIERVGLQPVLVDIDPGTGMPSVETTARAAEAGADAMIVVHWAGDVADVPALSAAAGLTRDRVIVDAAHALGSQVHDHQVGGEEGLTCFSFYATKNLPIGEGGMVTTGNPELATRMRQMRLHGMSADAWRRYLPGGSWRYDVAEPGLKANMTDLQAAIGIAQLDHFDAWQQRRRVLAGLYDGLLAEAEDRGLLLRPHRPAVGEGLHAWHLYPVRILAESRSTRDEIVAELGAAGIGTSVHFIPLHHLRHFRATCVLPPGGLPGADAHHEQNLSLPLHPKLTAAQVRRVCRELIAALTSEVTTP